MLFRYIFTIDFKIICYICPQNHQWKNGETLTYTDIGRHILIVTKCVYLYQYKSRRIPGRSALPLRLLKNVRSKELNTHYDYGKMKYLAKGKTVVSTNSPKVLAFASPLGAFASFIHSFFPMDCMTMPFCKYCNLTTL